MARSTVRGGKQRRTDPFPFLSLVLPHGDIPVAGACPGGASSRTVTCAVNYTSFSSLTLTSPTSPTAAAGR